MTQDNTAPTQAAFTATRPILYVRITDTAINVPTGLIKIFAGVPSEAADHTPVGMRGEQATYTIFVEHECMGSYLAQNDREAVLIGLEKARDLLALVSEDVTQEKEGKRFRC